MNSIIISKKDIDIKASLECGQTFRFKESNGEFYIYSKDEFAKVVDEGENYKVYTTNTQYFYNYFNLDLDYKKILAGYRKNPMLKDIIKESTPIIRILKQDAFELIISAIISANNNIPRIKGIINRLCNDLGEQKEGYKAFPKPETLANQTVEYYKNAGLGYRASYILKTSQMIVNGFDINSIYYMDTNSAMEKLLTLPGVGPKVADCILLFGYNKYDVFPVDTWIKKVYIDLFKREATPNKMRKDLLEEFGEYAGIAQQYLFANKRENN